MTVRERLMQAVVQGLEHLTPAEVQRCVPYTDETDFIAVWDLTEGSDVGAYGVSDNTVSLVLEYVKPSTADLQLSEDGNAMLGALRTQMESGVDFGELSAALRYTGSNFNYVDQGQTLVGVGATYDLIYETRVGNPNAQP